VVISIVDFLPYWYTILLVGPNKMAFSTLMASDTQFSERLDRPEGGLASPAAAAGAGRSACLER
jgi:hypothetical protein